MNWQPAGRMAQNRGHSSPDPGSITTLPMTILASSAAGLQRESQREGGSGGLFLPAIVGASALLSFMGGVTYFDEKVALDGVAANIFAAGWMQWIM